MGKKNLPIKVILQRKEDISRNSGGGKVKFFGEITNEIKDEITNKLNGIASYYDDIFSLGDNIPVVCKIVVKDKAIAKSHKPDSFCREMPIIGSENLNEIYFKTTKSGIVKTINLVEKLPSEEFKANLTAIENISPYYEQEKISRDIIKIQKINKFDKIKDKIKIKLFNFQDEYDNKLIENHFISELVKLDLNHNFKVIKYGDKINYIKIQVRSYEDIVKISSINGVKSIDFFQQYATQPNNLSEGGLEFVFNENEIESDIIIGIIDGGISQKNTYLNKWIYGREQYVGDEYIDTRHGTFIASTIQYGNILNDIEGEVSRRFSFLDVIALPNSDPYYGPVDSLSEDDLMDIIEAVVSKHNKEVKIWNLSLGVPDKICENKISDLAVFCDYIQDTYDVQFFISSGNLDDGPYREWPSQFGIDEVDRLISPADSVRAITVGAISYNDSCDSVTRRNEPSPFSRRGPGANFIVKPDVVDYGGNCRINGDCNGIGMKGLDEYGNIIEGIGTSYSNPRIVRKFATIFDEMLPRDILLAKAMLIHSARLNSRDVISYNNENIRYYGFGMPDDKITEVLKCSENEATLVFKQSIMSGSHLELMDFPYPESLIRNGKYVGEICMTLAYQPELNEDFGQEYCRANINVGFGPYKYSDDGKIDYKSEVPLEKKWESKYESEQVENGFKWSPIKSYYRNIKQGINQKDGWKLRVDMTPRYKANISKQDFILIITIKAPEENMDIYSEIINGLRTNGYISNDLEIKSQLRVR